MKYSLLFQSADTGFGNRFSHYHNCFLTVKRMFSLVAIPWTRIWAPQCVKSRRPPSDGTLLSYFQSLDNGPIEAVQLPLEATVLSPATILLSCTKSHRLVRPLTKERRSQKKHGRIPSTSLGHRCPYMHFRSSHSLPNLQGVIRLTYLSVAISFLLGL